MWYALMLSMSVLMTTTALRFPRAAVTERQCLFSLESAKEEPKQEQETEQDRKPEPEPEQRNALWTVHNEGRNTLCAARCIDDAKCDLFLINSSAKLCTGLRKLEGAAKRKLLSTQPGSRVYKRMCKVRSSPVGNACRIDSDCVDQDIICFKKVCLCKPILLYSTSNKDCRKCNTTSSSFTWYSGLGIDDYNDLIVHDVSSGKQCQKLCVEELSFVCRSAEHITDPAMAYFTKHSVNTCILSQETFSTVPKVHWNYESFGWTLQLRDCI